MSSDLGGIYLAGPLGFTDSGRNYHDQVIRPAIGALGFSLLDPWPVAESIFAEVPGPGANDHEERLRLANHRIGESNKQMIEQSSAVLAILDGSDVDSGTASEIGFAYAIGRPIVGLRTDMRMSGDNVATTVNLQVGYFVEASGGTIATSLQSALSALTNLLGGTAPPMELPRQTSRPVGTEEQRWHVVEVE